MCGFSKSHNNNDNILLIGNVIPVEERHIATIKLYTQRQTRLRARTVPYHNIPYHTSLHHTTKCTLHHAHYTIHAAEGTPHHIMHTTDCTSHQTTPHQIIPHQSTLYHTAPHTVVYLSKVIFYIWFIAVHRQS